MFAVFLNHTEWEEYSVLWRSIALISALKVVKYCGCVL